MWLCRTTARSPELSVTCGRSPRSPAPSQVPRPRRRAGRSRCRDRRDEAAVEGIGEACRLVEAVPAEPDRGLVDLQLAGVVEAKDLHRGEMRREQLAVLGGCPTRRDARVLGLLSVGARKRQPVRGRDVCDWGDPRIWARSFSGSWMCSIVSGRRRRPWARRTPRSCAAGSCSLELVSACGGARRPRASRRPDHLGRGARQDVRPVAFAARQVRDLHAAAAPGDPLVDGDVALVPVVLLRYVGESRSPVSSSGGTPSGWSAWTYRASSLIGRTIGGAGEDRTADDSGLDDRHASLSA